MRIGSLSLVTGGLYDIDGNLVRLKSVTGGVPFPSGVGLEFESLASNRRVIQFPFQSVNYVWSADYDVEANLERVSTRIF